MPDLILTGREALDLLLDGKTIDFSQVTIRQPLGAVHALHLRNRGVWIPDALISFTTDEDDYIDYDPEFDEDILDGSWELIDSDVEDHKNYLHVKLNIDADV